MWIKNFFTIASNPSSSLFCLNNLKQFKNINRLISTQKWEFTDNQRDINGVMHCTIHAETEDEDPMQVAAVIQRLISNYPDSLFFLTEKSRLLRRDSDNPNYYLPLKKNELSNISLMIKLTKNQWLRPHAGHTCMAITDQYGSILENTHVSLRPGKSSILPGKTALHPKLYSPLFSHVKTARHTRIDDETYMLAHKMLKDNSISANLTVIPIAETQTKLMNILENIKSAKAINLYNLCSLVVKQKDINDITDSTIRGYVEELKKRAEEFPELKHAVTSEGDTVLAALACTHAIAKACYGDTHAIDRQIGSDQDTQTAVVYCTMALIGTEKFIDFARKINFHDEISELTKSNTI